MINQKKYPVARASIVKAIKEAAKKNKNIRGRVEVLLTDNAGIKKLNKIWRNINRPTDVLAFAWAEENRIKSDYLGQIIISYPMVAAQAKEYGVKAKEEFIRMLVHGLLHLVGFNHERSAEAKKMFNFQESIIKKIIR